MAEGYFHRVHRLSPTRLWINNPTLREADLAIEAGAVSCTTNPTYSSRQLAREDRDMALAAVDEALREHSEIDRAADLVQQKLVAPILKKFRPLWERDPGIRGFVSIQGNPFHDDDPDFMIAEMLRYRNLGPNFIAKIPVTEAGLRVLEAMVEENIPSIATEVMSISQAVQTCEMYLGASRRSGNTPPFYLTHITGIFDEHLSKVAAKEGIDIDRDLLWQAGTIVAREQYRIMKERGYPGILLGGGARDLHHFTEFVGGDVHVTINWKGSADRLIEQDPPVVYRMDTPAPRKVVDELLEKVPDFRMAYREDGLEKAEYADWGPVELFRSSFMKGWKELEAAIEERRSR